jgi:hypothetical protein
VGYWAYSLTANAAPRRTTLAIGHGRDLLQLERWLHIGAEHAINAWWAAARDRIVASNLYYDVMHFAVPCLVLFFLYLRRPERYVFVRTALLSASLLGLAVFWLWPTAPPRLIPGAGFVDTIARVQTFGAGGSHGITASENPFAAMPSLHVAWASWAAVSVWLVTRRVWLRVLATVHVVLTVFFIVATGNHFFVDAVGGGLVVGAGFAIAARLPRPVLTLAPTAD